MLPFSMPPPPVAEAQKALASEPPDRKAARKEIDQLWDAAERLAAADTNALARSAINLEGIRRALRLMGTADCAALGLPEGEVPLVQHALTHGLEGTVPPVDALARAHANAALKLSAEDRLVGDWMLKRFVRIGVALALGGALAIAAAFGIARMLEPADLAAGKPWRTSSKLADCHPAISECAGAITKILFHTQEDANPWFQIDLEKPTEFSKLTIVNRSDFGESRAVPLVVEISDDGNTFTEIARRTDTFSTWKPVVEPKTARYVRVRVDRRSYLHLEAVRVHR